MLKKMRFDRLHRIQWPTLVILSISLAGCGGSSGGGGTSDTTAPAVTKTTPDNGGALLPGDSITVNFNEPIDSSSVALGGDMALESDGGTVTKSAGYGRTIRVQSDATGTTLTIAPQTTWATGNDQTLTVDVKDMAGNSLPTLSLAYHIVDGIVYVSTPANGGDDANDGTREHPKATIPAAISKAEILGYDVNLAGAVVVSQGTYQVNSAATPATHVRLLEGISLYGGYSSDFSQRDTETHTTTIEDVSTKVTGDYQNPNRTIEAGNTITSGATVDGFTIQGTQTGAGDYSAAFFNNGGSPILQNNKIHGGEGTKASIGVLIGNGAAPVIENNAIDAGGGGNESDGIAISYSGSAIIRGNTIRGGMGTSRGIGIINESAASVILQNNTIIGSENSGESYGIWNLTAGSNTIIQNNTIFGGTGTNTWGIYNESGASPTIQNNTIDGGTGTTLSIGIVNSGAAPSPSNSLIQNNIVFTSPGSGQRYCLSEVDFLSNPGSVENNDLFDCPTALYRDYPNNNLSTIDAVNALTDTSAGGNVSIDPVFVDTDGPDGDISTMADNDWHLSSSSPASPATVTQGGLDLSGDFTTDKDGKTRTVPWSMGAYERDN
jgi:Bacterial Ig-like domain